MRVLVDTSVWVDFFNGHPSPAADTLAALIEDEIDLLTCGVVVAEFMQGIRDRMTLKTLEGHFNDMEWLTPKEPDTYFSAAKLFRGLRGREITIRSTIGCLVAQLSAENNALLLSKDRDLELILKSGLINVKPVMTS